MKLPLNPGGFLRIQIWTHTHNVCTNHARCLLQYYASFKLSTLDKIITPEAPELWAKTHLSNYSSIGFFPLCERRDRTCTYGHTYGHFHMPFVFVLHYSLESLGVELGWWPVHWWSSCSYLTVTHAFTHPSISTALLSLLYCMRCDLTVLARLVQNGKFYLSFPSSWNYITPTFNASFTKSNSQHLNNVEYLLEWMTSVQINVLGAKGS